MNTENSTQDMGQTKSSKKPPAQQATAESGDLPQQPKAPHKSVNRDTWLDAWLNNKVFWIACYIAVLSYPFFSESPSKYWHAATLLFLVVFVHIFTAPIPLPPAEDMQQADKLKKEEENREKEKYLRRNWMIVAYGFMLFALVVSIYPFTTSWHSEKKENLVNYANTMRERPIAVFVGCSLDSWRADTEIGCKPQTIKPGEGKQEEAKKEAGAPAAPAAHGKSWLLSIGGYVSACERSNGNNGSPLVCNVEGGLLIPLYIIILSLMGGSISLTRRLPEYQKQASPGYAATEKQPKLTQHEFREYLIFQIIQYVSAPFIAVVAYCLVQPKDVTASVVLAFMAGFASESILLMIRSVAEKITPKTGAAPAFGTVTGTVSLADKGTGANRVPLGKAEVLLTEAPQIRATTDESGHFVLGNVPVGQHAVKVSYTKPGETTKSEKTDTVKIEKAQVVVTKLITIEK
ncbi:MAG TPA: carboxypeptidase-like regulatory domain-containing protein [Gammaproteobacteria bacterium]